MPTYAPSPSLTYGRPSALTSDGLLRLALVAMRRLRAVLHGLAAPPVSSSEAALAQIEPRLRAIYEQRHFGENPGRVPLVFTGSWLPCSTGYTVQEPDGTVQYDAATGEHSALEPAEPGSDVVRPPPAAGGPISHGQARRSADGRRIVYVQTDSSEVRLRSTLVPDDPSYPGVAESRFARVGGAIPKLRVGVVGAAGGGGETEWLTFPTAEEGFYLGQVDWAGNSEEVLIEKLSRFRDEREFLLVNVDSGERSCIFRDSDPAWVVASIAKNAGLQWIQGGQAFIVLSERDGWRHAYACSRDGQQQTLLTPGEYDIIEKVNVDEHGGWLYFNASPDNATQKYLHRVSLDGSGVLERVTPHVAAGATHEYDFSPDGQLAFHTSSSFECPPVCTPPPLGSQAGAAEPDICARVCSNHLCSPVCI